MNAGTAEGAGNKGLTGRTSAFSVSSVGSFSDLHCGKAKKRKNLSASLQIKLFQNTMVEAKI